MSVAILGPTQPYLAKQVGVNIDNINFVWTTRLEKTENFIN
jgi:hypothetical protein